MGSDHAGCPDVIRATALELGTEVTVSTEPPIVDVPYATAPFTCPHGTTYWVEPTSEQIAAWARAGVA